MMGPSSKTQRRIAIADNIWHAFEEMAAQMGAEREALINQAMFMFARLNGFLDVQRDYLSRTVVQSGDGERPPALPPRRSEGGTSRVMEGFDDDEGRQARVMEAAAELERSIRSRQSSTSLSLEEGAPMDWMGEGAGGVPGSYVGKTLYVQLDTGEPEPVIASRFVIGRGRHCNLVVQSGKVSREHAEIIREGDDYYIADLDSSNGTWFNKQRLKQRRRIEDGEEYYICSERVRASFR
ncbi:MAG: FHA domain-containing protein [Proteobacteria bacterium]|nr:FHA domain-containing protein [Cystobacterineae bacterium]MCL2259339.1 FHA domain-containing protein [Cystobacterineae bacterium]MCL2314207.1 FHA domain-containing protein [Pseudomonadota bacterium]